MGKYVQSKKRTMPIIFLILLILLIIAGMLVGGFFLYMANRKLPQGMHIAGVQVGGMKSKEAISAVNDALQNSYLKNDMEITVDGYAVSIPALELAITMDVETAISDAFAQTDTNHVFDMFPYLTFNKSAIKDAIQQLEEHFDSDFTESSYEVIGTRPSLTADEVSGEGQRLVLYAGTPDYKLDTEGLYKEILDCYNEGVFSLEFPLEKRFPTRLNIDEIYEAVCVEPIDAVMDMETFEVSQHSYGYVFDKEVAQSILPNILFGSTGEVPFQRVAPKVYYDDLFSLLYRDELGSYTAYSSSEYNRDINLKLSCEAINGVILFPNETFSYNQTLGERTPEKGYKPAAGYWGKEVVDSYGGGICQASSSLYYCALYADLEIIERHNHGYASAYMPLGMDATVDWAGPDLKIKNNTQYPIKIEAYASGGMVAVKLWGTDTKDYYIDMTYEILKVEEPETIYVEMEEDNEKGYKDGDVITTPYTGYDVRTYKSKYSKETNELISRELEEESSYWKRDKEICKILQPETTAPPETVPPETTAPAETTPPTESAPPTSSVTEDA